MAELEHILVEKGLAEWVEELTQEWRDHYSSNYETKQDEYYRLWRGIWAEDDKTRQSERSKIIAPALQQAVESAVAEIETASFSQAFMFDIDDSQKTPPPPPQGQPPQMMPPEAMQGMGGGQQMPQMPPQMAQGPQNQPTQQESLAVRDQLHRDLERANYRAAIGEILINAAVYGTGIGEIVIEDSKEYVPSTMPLDGMPQEANLVEYGTETKERPLVKLHPIQPKNFLIDPNATCISSAMGVCVEEFVGIHAIEQLQEAGVYRDLDLQNSPSDADIDADSEITHQPVRKVRVKRYYGLVPTDLLKEEGVDSELLEDGKYTEAVIVVANGEILKAQANPYMCQDRPIAAFPWDVVPSRFWGRGVCEKGYMSQKALDAEMRARIDALALTTHPMMAIDATRIHRGDKFEVRPGKVLLTNGAPQESVMPFKFGQVDQISFSQAQNLQMMVQQATGSQDAAEMAKGPSSDTTSAGISMSMGAVMKRQRRTLVNFQESFFKPLIKKTAWRYMQFDPEKYPSKNYHFSVISSLGVIAREYEVQQLAQILQVIPPQSPAHGAMIKAIIEHMNVTSKEKLLEVIDQSGQPNPQAMEMQQQQAQAQMQLQQAQTAVLMAQAKEAEGRAAKYAMEIEMMPKEAVLKYADQDKDGKVDDDFEKKIQLANMLMQEDKWNLEKEERQQNMQNKMGEQQMLQQMLQPQQPEQPQQMPPMGEEPQLQ
jgi:hypothetical protein